MPSRNSPGVSYVRKRVCRKLIILLSTVFAVVNIYANPTGGEVAAGSATITQSGTHTEITQTTDKAIVNWQSFNIGANESTHFQQPSSSSITLNRINPGQGASQIFGSLTSNGRIILVNQAGIYFSASAHVDVGGIMASTVDITDQNFLAGKYVFDQPSSLHGTVVNRGTIIAANNGLVALIGSNVSNEGYIQAHAGSVVLASGEKFTVDLNGDGLVHFTVDQAASGVGVDPENHPMQDGVKNSGTIIADGGKIVLTAKTASGVVDNAINMSGVVQAHSVSQKNGEIIFSAEGPGVVRVAGTIDASGKTANHTGGKVKILGAHIQLKSPTVIDVSGINGGGEVLIGGNYRGLGPEQNALTTVIDSGVMINANALLYGNGGRVIAWSDGYTGFHGNISAQGGIFGGNGGFVETSGHYLTISGGRVNLLAPNGFTGDWLLDPTDLTISASGSSNLSSGSNPFVGDNNSTSSNLDVADLVAALGGANVTVQTTAGGTGLGSGDITVATGITWSTATKLTLDAYRNIIINAPISGINGSLELSATNAAQSITTGALGTVNVANFNLLQGQWYQVGSLPTFSASNSFQIDSGSITPTGVEFLRASSGNGGGTPYVIQDIYGLQGINSSSTLLGSNFILGADINASATTTWNSGAGFIPIGNASVKFSGDFDGANHAITGLYFNNNGVSTVGLFGYLDGATISDLAITSANFNAADYVGVLAGRSNASTISGVTTSGAFTGLNFMGGLIGEFIGGTITNSSTNVTITKGSGFDKNYAGGMVGVNSGTISNSYSTGNISGGSGFQNVGGFVGYNVGSITNSYATGNVSGNDEIGGFVGTTDVGNSISNSYATGNVSGGIWDIGGFVGIHISGTIDNSYAMGSVTSNGASTRNGGFVGANEATIKRSYSTGYQSNASGGAFAGVNSGTISNSYWNVDTVGRGSDGSSSASAGGTGKSTANMMLQSTYCASGNCSGSANEFDFATTWGIIAGTSYPYLLAFNSTTPQVFSGSISGSGAATGSSVKLVSNGVNIARTTAGANGFYYFLIPTTVTTTNPYVVGTNPALVYLSGASAKSNAIQTAASGTSSITNFNLSTANNIEISVANFSNSLLATLLGSISDSNIQYTASGNNLSLYNSTLHVANGNAYTVDGNIDTNISASSSAVNFSGAVTNNGYNITTIGSQTYTGGVSSNASVSLIAQGGSGNITIGSSGYTMTGANTLSLQADNNIILNGPIAITGGTLQLSAANSSQSITTDSSGTINVANFDLLQGQWYQVGSLPSFTVSNDFQLDSGNSASNTVEFLRASSGDGSFGNPFIINDIYGLQGINSANYSGNHLLAQSFALGSNIDASVTSNWNSGEGFRPIGTGYAPFTGTFDGTGYVIDNLSMSLGTTILNGDAGLFGNLSGSVTNVGLTNINYAITATDYNYNHNIGGLAGTIGGGGNITTSYVTGTIVSSDNCNGGCLTVGGLAGILLDGSWVSNSFTNTNIIATMNTNGGGSIVAGFIGSNWSYAYPGITNSYSLGSVTATGTGSGGKFAAGFLGYNVSGATTTNSFSSGNVSGSGVTIGGFAAINNATISNSFWDTATSGQSSGIGTGDTSGVTGGTFDGSSGSNLSSQTTFTSAGWTFDASNWGILDSQSYPYLRTLFTSTPSAISGIAVGSSTVGNTIQLAANGSVINSSGLTQGTALVGANGFYYFLLPNGTLSNGDAILTYLSGASTKGNAIALAGSGGNLINLNINAANNIDIGTATDSNAYSNSTLMTALGGLNSTDILFSNPSGNIINLGNATNTIANLNISSSNATYTINGNITADGGATATTVSFAGALINNGFDITTLGSQTYSGGVASNDDVTLTATGGSSDITIGSGGYTMTGAKTLSLVAGRNIILNGPIAITSGSLNLTAADSAQSITTGASGTIDVANFDLLQGRWYQVGTLPSFAVSNNFHIAPGSNYPSVGARFNASFLRAAGGDGSSNTPYQIADIYGLQGLATQSMSNYYLLNGNIDATPTTNWTAGFVPIGEQAGAGYSGVFDGQNYTINNLYINANNYYVGLFGITNGGTIQNLGLTNVNINTTNSVFSGVLAGEIYNGTNVNNVYVTGRVTANAGGGLNAVGGLTAGYNSAAAGGSINNVYTNVIVTLTNGAAGSSAGGLVGAMWNVSGTSTITNSHSTGNITAYGAGVSVGGLVGEFNGTSSISNSYSAAVVNGSGNVGGLTGWKAAGATFNNNYWDISTSGQTNAYNTSNGSVSGATGLNTTNLMQQANFSGFTFDASHWGIIEGSSYPYLRTLFSSTPSVVSGVAIGAGTVGNTLQLAVNGSSLSNTGLLQGTTYAGANGFYYFLLPNGTLSNGDAILTYLSGASTKGNAIALAGSGGNLINLNINAANNIDIGTATDSNAYSNSTLMTALGGLNSTDILFSNPSGNIINLGNATNTIANLNISSSNATYTINGNITADGGATATTVSFAGALINNGFDITTLGSQTYSGGVASNDGVTLTANGVSSDITIGSGGYTMTGANTLALVAGRNIILNGPISITSGTLNLTAADSAQSITTGASGTVDVANFNLLQGRWYQVGTLPSFNVSNNFEIASGAATPTGVEFLRATSGGSKTPYGLADIYGLQGINSSAALRAESFVLDANIDASSTANWNSGAGFIPIGETNTSYFSGSLNGQNHKISDLFINNSSVTTYGVGLFSAVSNATIQNIGLENVNISSSNGHVGALVGFVNWNTGYGAIINNTYSTGNVSQSGSAGVAGGLIGYFGSGTVSNSYSTANVTSSVNTTSAGTGGLIGNFAFGGGASEATLSGSFSTGRVIGGGTSAGGLIGRLSESNTGAPTVTDSYSLSSVSGSGIVSGFIGLVDEYNISRTSSVSNSYSAGRVSGSGTLGGFIGQVDANQILLSSGNYWDTDTSGQSTGIGSNLGSISGTAPTGKTTAELQTALPIEYSGGTWSIISDASYPYLLNFYSTAPSVVSGIAIDSTTAGDTMRIAVNGEALSNNGLIQDTAYIGANGYYYFLQPNGTIGTEQVVLTYLSGASKKGNAIGVANFGGMLTTLNINAENNIDVGTATDVNSYNNSTLRFAISNVSSGDLLFSGSGDDITLGYGSNMIANLNISSSDLDYSLTGVIDTMNGATSSVYFASPVTINYGGSVTTTGAGGQTYNGAVQIGTNTILSAGIGNILFNSTIDSINSTPINLTLNGSGVVTFNDTIGSNYALGSLSVNGGSTTINTSSILTAGSQSYSGITSYSTDLNLTASDSSSSIQLDSMMGTNALTLSAGNHILINGDITGANISLTSGTGNTGVGGIAIGGGITSTGDVSLSGAMLFGQGGVANLSTSISIGDGIQASGDITLAGTQFNNDIELTGNITSTGNDDISITPYGTGIIQLTNSNISTQNGIINLSNTLNLNSNINISTADNGSITLANGVTGGSYNLVLSGASAFNLTGSMTLNNLTITGGNGVNNTLTLQAPDSNTTYNWNVSAANTGQMTSFPGISGSFGFSGIQNLVGGTQTDYFTINGGSINGSINGGGGSNTLAHANSSTWEITGINSGSVTDVGSSFSNMQNLVGGSGTTIFNFADGGIISGSVSGGSSLAAINFNYSVPLSLTMQGEYNGYIRAPSLEQTLTSYSNINSVSGVTTLTLANKVNDIVVTGAGTFYIGDPFYFSGVNNVIGNSQSQVTFGVPTELNRALGIATVGGYVFNFANFNANAFYGNIIGNTASVTVIPTQVTNNITLINNSALNSMTRLATTVPELSNIVGYNSLPQSITVNTTTSTTSTDDSSSDSTDNTSTTNNNNTVTAIESIDLNMTLLVSTQQTLDFEISNNQKINTQGMCGR